MSMMDIQSLLGGMNQQQPQAEPDEPRSDTIRGILEDCRAAAQTADDEQEALTWEKITTLIQQLLVEQQKQDEQLRSGTANPSALRRALGG